MLMVPDVGDQITVTSSACSGPPKKGKKKHNKKPKKTPKKKGGIGLGKNRAVNIGLNLVGMLRPPGFGNLQGFVGYQTGIFGLPLDLLFGVQNDGDSPEIMGEDREQPILRLQPKVHFDCDL